MRINVLTSSVAKVLPLGLKAIGLSIGATAISLGVNLAHLDFSAAQAASTFDSLAADTPAGIAPAETTVYHVADGNTDEGIVFASEIFGPSSSSVSFPADTTATTNYLAVGYSTDSLLSSTDAFLAIFKLTNNAVFDEDPILLVDNEANGTINSAKIAPVTGGGGKNSSFVKMKFEGGFLGADDTNPKLILVYKLRGLSALANPGSKIEMSFEINDVLESYSRGIISAPSITVAKSAQAITASLTPNNEAEASLYRVSVENNYVEFSGTSPSDEAVIGVLKLTQEADIYCPDGETKFKLGVADNCGEVGGPSDTKAALTITGGQFAASVAADGMVKVKGETALAEALAADESTAVIPLDDDALDALVTDGMANITIVADGETPINIPEDAPVASLSIAYADDTFATTVVEGVELLRIKADGTQCTVYNVPGSSAADTTAIRITNTSSVAGTVTATLYGLDGTEIFTAQPLNGGDPIASNATLVITPVMLEAFAGTWTGRAVLVLNSTLSSIEVLALLRETGDATAPVTNLSVGASGGGCIN